MELNKLLLHASPVPKTPGDEQGETDENEVPQVSEEGAKAARKMQGTAQV